MPSRERKARPSTSETAAAPSSRPRSTSGRSRAAAPRGGAPQPFDASAEVANEVQPQRGDSSPPPAETAKPARQRGVGRGPRAHEDSGLTEEQAVMLHRMLLDVRRSLLQEHLEHLDSGRFNTERIPESEEAAAWDTSQSTLIDLAESERRRLVEIERALRKLDDGSYGVSEESGEPIGFERLRVLPWARLSAADQEDFERRSRDRGR